MKALDLMQELFRLSAIGPITGGCDTCKAGDPTREISRVAVAMFPTVDIIREAAAWGADLLIVHEPMYYNHMDNHADEAIEAEKRALVESTGMTIFRFHDHPHAMANDQITDGFWQALGLTGEFHWDHHPELDTLRLSAPITPRALARLIEQKLGIAHVRICGASGSPCTHLSAALGSCGNAVMAALQKSGTEIVIAGEVCEWAHAEYTRDAAALGRNKALLILGHIGSERDGVELLSRYIAGQHPELTVKYFECGEVYTYTDRA